MISISKDIQLERMTIPMHQNLLALMYKIYPPAYKHLWKDEDCNWYLNKNYNINNFIKELNEVNAESYFIIYNAVPIGQIRILFDKNFKDRPKNISCYLHRIYLSEEAQGKGIGGKVLDWLEKRAKKRSNELIWLESMDTQTQALRFYQKQGFIKSGVAILDFELMHEPLRGMILFFKLLK